MVEGEESLEEGAKDTLDMICYGGKDESVSVTTSYETRAGTLKLGVELKVY